MSSSTQQTPGFETIFDLQVPEGRCVGLRLILDDDDAPFQVPPPPAASNGDDGHHHHWLYQYLHPDEIDFARNLPSQPVQQSFLVGRLALRKALNWFEEEEEDVDGQQPSAAASFPPILKDQHGRPLVPSGYLGSISHKGATGVALLSRQQQQEDQNIQQQQDVVTSSIGVDIEETVTRRRSVASKVLTPEERERLGRIPGVSEEEEVLLRFSLKESLYKAMHPLICQYVGFQEVQVEPDASGTAQVHFQLKSGAHSQLQNVTAHWRRVGPYFLSSSSMQRATTGDSSVAEEELE